MENVAENIERKLTVSILRGEYTVGARLPTVRELAETFRVNPSTVHRALKGLESTRLVSPRRGSGVVINDPRLVSDLSLMPAWIEALLDQPSQAAKFLAELLQMRRLVAADLSAKHREKIIKRKNEFKALTQAANAVPKKNIRAMREADFAIMRFLLEIVGNTAGQLIMNIMPQVYERVPEVEQACYYWTQKNHSISSTLTDILMANKDEGVLRRKLEDAFLDVDKVSVKRFKLLLTRRLKERPAAG